MFARTIPFALALLMISVAQRVNAQPHGHDHEHGKPVDFKMPTTYKAAVAEIRMRLHEIDELISTKKLADVHGEAEVIQKVGNVVGQLALKADSGVPKAAVKEVNKAGRALASKFDEIDKAGDSGDAAGTRKVYAEMVPLADVLYKYSPKDFACPMKCEGEKTYPAAQACPKCGMDLQDVNSHQDHSAKHGGIFFMAPDKKHHLEGTLADNGEFRIYFYDEYTKPIPAGKFTAKGTAWTNGKVNVTPLTMTVGPTKDWLAGPVNKSVVFPMRIKIFIDFKDGHEPQVFDFDFDGPSKAPNNDTADAAHESSGEHKGKGHGHVEKP
ncbi:MAG: hypothetical protein HZA51_16020 [Planctomycetes bacterium]|nr:hypothetical protein [Planctomycetota bacterium]